MSEMESVRVVQPEEESQINELSGEAASVQRRFIIWSFLKRNIFVILTMIAVASGIGLGFALQHSDMSARDIKYFTFPGELLMRILQMLVLPLIVSSVITGLSNADAKAYGRIGLRAIGYYMITTLIAVFTGIALTLLIQPGKSSRQTSESSAGQPEAVKSLDSFLDLIRNMFPDNLVEAGFRKYKTVYSSNESNGNHLNTSANVPMPGSSDGMNVLGLLAFSIAFGLTLSSMGSQGKPLRDFFDCLNKTTMRLVSIVIWYSPVGLIFLLAGQVVKITDSAEMGREVAIYVLTVVTGLLIHSLFTLPLIYLIVTRKNPLRFIGGILQALITAFGTSSSSATLPVTLHCMERNHNIDQRVTRFMLPIGATVNMDGAALYDAVAALFVAQINNIDFNFGQIILLSVVVTLVTTGAAAIPHAGMVFILIVLSATGLPTEDVSLILIFDWLLDRLLTVNNVLGDCVGVGVVQHLSKRELQISGPAGKNAAVEENHII